MTVSSSPRPHNQVLEVLSLTLGVILGSVAAIIMIVLILAANIKIGVLPLVNTLHTILPVSWYANLLHLMQAMGFPLQGETPAYWYMSRASALLGYFFIWASTLWGLLLSTKIVKSMFSSALIFSVHEFLSLLGLGFATFHAFILMGDRYINFTLGDILFPFTASFKPTLVGIGTISLYLYTLIIISYFFRKRIGRKVWRTLHYFTFFTYIFVAIHGVLTGTDSSFTLMRVVYLVSAASILFLVYYRLLTAVTPKPTRTPFRRVKA